MYLLIVGAPRSGTTLLASMIGMHSDVAMLIEDRWFSIKKLTGKKVLANKLCIPIQLDFTKRATYFTRLMKKLGSYQNYPASKYNMEDYLQLEGLKVITLIRDKDDVVNSIMKRGRKEKIIAEKRWKMAMQIMHRLNTEHADKTVTVSYEDLVGEPERLLKKLSDFIGIDFQPQMLEGYKHNILYPGENGIDKSRAFRSKALNGDGFEKTSKSNELYENLMGLRMNP